MMEQLWNMNDRCRMMKHERYMIHEGWWKMNDEGWYMIDVEWYKDDERLLIIDDRSWKMKDRW